MQEPEFTITEGMRDLEVVFTDTKGRKWVEHELQEAIDEAALYREIREHDTRRGLLLTKPKFEGDNFVTKTGTACEAHVVQMVFDSWQEFMDARRFKDFMNDKRGVEVIKEDGYKFINSEGGTV